jgi:mRNA-degrading endonuclease toxin of MazEF toxin-antitoxin module
MNKDFDNWNDLKKKLEKREKFPSFKEREIWWISIGTNNGDELCGKSKLFSRPVLIVKKFNNHFFFGIPLSSVQKDNPYYFNFEFKGKKQSAIMCQAKPISVKRLSTKIGEIEKELANAINKKASRILFNPS